MIFNDAVYDYKASDCRMIDGRIVENNSLVFVRWFSIQSIQSKSMLLPYS